MSFDTPNTEKPPRDFAMDHWRATCAVWINDLCMHGVKPMGYVYAYRRCHGELDGNTEERKASDGRMFLVKTRRRKAGQATQDRIQERAAEMVAELYELTGVPVGKWAPLVQRIMASPDLMALIEARGFLPKRPDNQAQAERERRSGITESQRQANADAIAATF
jgi:hypothetical protein